MNVVAELLFSSPAPALIWVLLMALSLPAVFLLASPESVREPRRSLTGAMAVLRRRQDRRERRRRAAADAVRYAGELTVAAGRAEESAGRWLELWQEAVRRSEAARQHWQDAEQRLARTRPDQERAVHRAVAAHRHDLYRQAAAAERAAWRDSRLAISARDGLRREVARDSLRGEVAPARPARAYLLPRRDQLAGSATMS